MSFSTTIIVCSILGALFSHYYIIYKLGKNNNFFESTKSTIILSFETLCYNNIVGCILLIFASYLIENEKQYNIKNNIPNFIYSTRYFCLLLLTISCGLKRKLNWDELKIFKHVEKKSLIPITEIKHLLKITEKRKELAERRLNFFKSFSFVPIFLLFINNLNSLKETNPNLNIDSLLLLNKFNIYVLLGIVIYLFFTYSAFDKC